MNLEFHQITAERRDSSSHLIYNRNMTSYDAGETDKHILV